MHRHCGTNNRDPWWTFTDPCKPEVRQGARVESASSAWLAAPAMNARDTTRVYIWRLDTGCGPTLYRKCHSYNTPGKRHNNLIKNRFSLFTQEEFSKLSTKKVPMYVGNQTSGNKTSSGEIGLTIRVHGINK